VVASLAVRHSPNAVKAFSVGYAGRPACDERADALAFANFLGIELLEVELSAHDVVDGFESLVTDMGEPLADAAGSGYRAVMRAAADHGIKVMLQGQGSDEIFWSYGWMRRALAENQLRDAGHGATNLLMRCIRECVGMPALGSPRAFAQWVVQAGGMSEALERFDRLRQQDPQQALFWDVARPMPRIAQAVSRLAGEGLAPAAGLQNARAAFRGRRPDDSWQRTLLKHILGTYLLENGISQADRYSMAAGVEARLPFVDYKLVEHAAGLADTHSDAITPGKQWLRSAVSDVIPDWVLQRPKRGFSPPTRDWVDALVHARGGTLHGGILTSMGVLSAQGAQSLAQPSGLFDRGLRDQLAYQALVLEQWFRGMKSIMEKRVDP
jgi:asparagine synthase (glutamine-hydrolysing)